MLAGKFIVVSASHPEKAPSSIFVTLDGISIVVNDLHLSKAPVPIVFTLCGIFIFSRLLTFLKKRFGILVKFSDNTIFFNLNVLES